MTRDQSTPSSTGPLAPSYPQAGDRARTYSILGFISAVASLIIVPEVFGSAAIILGAYAWKKEQGNRGIIVVIIGIVFMLIGIYFTADFALIDLVVS